MQLRSITTWLAAGLALAFVLTVAVSDAAACGRHGRRGHGGCQGEGGGQAVQTMPAGCSNCGCSAPAQCGGNCACPPQTGYVVQPVANVQPPAGYYPVQSYAGYQPQFAFQGIGASGGCAGCNGRR